MAKKIKKGDLVQVLSGKDKGKQEKVLEVRTADGKVLVDNVNKVKKHTKPTQGHAGGIIDKLLPINVSRVALVCPSCKKAVRVGFKIVKDKKVRFCKKCEAVIDK
ncbi:50S ribosomal protein L24 [Candidatus Termititenax spirochaetophilus]|uniref:Large ribosomal subunit protein uL24 n=1 Tax=Candidatus Termititenax spirochaetophilus TaxID=2218522 RepID=A0A388T6M2_9BACT|nr:50S ribosomal protein L24 [Candidatus Termititenax spirochaetophilus]